MHNLADFLLATRRGAVPGALSRSEASTISCAPAELLGVVFRMSPSAGRVSGGPLLDVTSGTFCSPLVRAALTRSFQPDTLRAGCPRSCSR